MKREQWTFLAVGFAFGVLFGLALFMALDRTPELDTSANMANAGAAAAPPAGGQPGGAAAGGAPMMAEIRALRQRVEDNPQDQAALVRLANIYHDVEMWDDAIEYYSRAIELGGDQPDLLTDMGICHRGKGEYETALALFERARAADASHWQSLFNMVVVAGFDLQQFDVAREALAAMEQMDPPPPRVDELRRALEQAEQRAQASGEG